VKPSAEADDFEGTDRFRIQRRLGAGSFGTVYEVFDRERGTSVALKVLKQADPAAIYRFKKEFRALADVAHPNLVELYELMSDGTRWFFTMELIDGVPFLSHVRGRCPPSVKGSTVAYPLEARREADTVEIPIAMRRPAPSPDWDRLRPLLLQLAEGVSALHAAGCVHRDIKPSNVMVTRDGRVVILDFGLVAELAPPRLDRSSGLHAVGTPAYMSPEQAKGCTVGEASDWYSVGVILYEALTGVLPFEGETFELLTSKLRDEAIAPRERVPDVPEDLDLLCRQLLQREEEKRPSGAEILERLRGGGRASRSSITGSSTVSRQAPFIGRKEHLAALHEAFARTKEGRVATLLVRGRSGMGKTTLVRHFLKELAERDPACIMLSGRCYERESMPYKALDSLIDALSQYLRALPAHEAEALLPHDVLTLARLFPVLKRVEVITRARRRGPEIPDSQELRRRAVAALRELFTRLADRVSLVLFIDDLQWGDADSAALLSAILRPPDPPPLLLIGCTRNESGDADGSGSFLPAHAEPLGDDPLSISEELFLDQLTPEEAEDLARGLLGKGGSAPEAARAIAIESRGNPLFLNELVLASLSEGPGRPAGSLTLHELIAERVSRLPDEARRLLEVVAIAGEPVERSIALRAADLEPAETHAVSLLQSNRLVRSHREKGQDALETTHDHVRETVVRALPEETAKTHHRRLAQALEAWGQADPEALAVHFYAAEELETAAEYVIAAARQASEALAFDRAARLYILAINLGAGEAETRALRVGLGDALANAGRGAESAEAYGLAAQGASAADNLELRRRAAEQLLRSGHVDRGIAAIRDVLGAVGMKLPESPRKALLSLLLRRAWIRVRGIRFHERDVSQVAAERLMKIDICWSVAAGLGLVDTIRGYDFQARQLLLALRAGEPYRVARALALEVAFNATGGGRNLRRTERLWKATSSLATRIGHPHTTGLAMFVAGLAAYLEGRWKTAQELCDRAEGILRERCTGVAWELASARFYALRSLVFMGRFEELSRRLPSCLEDAHSRGDLYEEVGLRSRVSPAVLLVMDKPEKARQESRETVARWSHRAYYLQHYYDLFGQTEVDLYEGNAEEAWRRIVAEWPAFRRSLLRRIQLVLLDSENLHARAVLAAVAAGKLSESHLKVAERDAGRIERARMAWSDPLAQLIRASVAAFRGDTRTAVGFLASAESGFETTDAGLYCAAARAQRGELMGGTEGERLVAEAETWMRSQRVANPSRLRRLLAPGRWTAGSA
jgi:eukaryotic-like serine/threonine-protein kinase